jgi:ribosomal protein S27AE
MDIDICSIDKKIRDIWEKNKEQINIINIEINDLEEIKNKEENKENFISLHVLRDIEEKIKKLEQQRNIIENISNIQHFYTMDFSELIEQHKSSVPNKISFMGKSSKKNNEISKIYLEILKKYDIEYKEIESLITNIKKTERKDCSNCGSSSFLIQSDQNIEICENCGKQEEKSYKSLSYKDIARVNMSSKYSYERKIHFKDCINQFQGKQNSTIDDKVFIDLEEQFDLHGLLIGDNNTTKKIRFQNIAKEHILLFLKENGHSKHYEDVVLIYHKMTGKKVDDISHLENKLMEDFDKISNLYDKKFKFTGKIDRKSFINTQYILFQLLRRHKYPCKKEDFNMLKTLDRKSFHDDIVRELFESLGFNFTPIF